MDMNKPHKGEIVDWFKGKYHESDKGYRIFGKFLNHPDGVGKELGHTSQVLEIKKSDAMSMTPRFNVETKNSRYTLVGPPLELDTEYVIGIKIVKDE